MKIRIVLTLAAITMSHLVSTFAFKAYEARIGVQFVHLAFVMIGILIAACSLNFNTNKLDSEQKEDLYSLIPVAMCSFLPWFLVFAGIYMDALGMDTTELKSAANRSAISFGITLTMIVAICIGTGIEKVYCVCLRKKT